MLALASLLLSLAALGAASPVEKRAFALNIFAAKDGQCFVPVPGPNNFVGDGTPVVSGRCGGLYSWDITYGSGPVKLSGFNLCLDAGTNPGNNGALKLWTCYPGLYQQTWYYTDDRRIAITGGNQCLDQGPNGIQTYQCTPNNGNQIFTATSNRGITYLPDGPTSQPTTTSRPPVTTTSSTSPTGSPSGYAVLPNIPRGDIIPYPRYGNSGRQIHPNGRPDLCLTAATPTVGDGTQVVLARCFPLNDPYINNQLWDIPGVYVTGKVKLYQKNYCLDFGTNPSSGVLAKVWTCYDGLPQQQFYYTSNQIQLADINFNMCLDVKLGSQPNKAKPYSSVGDVQSWACNPGFDNPNQQWPKSFNPPIPVVEG